MRIIKFILFTLITIAAVFFSSQAQNQSLPSREEILIDSICIKKNWRTKSTIILQELKINPGQTVTHGLMDTAMIRIWNIGNFSSIQYQIDTLRSGKNLLKIIAKDAFTIVPNLSFNGNKNNFQLSAGVTDENFLGKNIKLNLAASTGSQSKYFNLSTTLPRQILYRNMSVSSNLTHGSSINYKYANGIKVSGVGYRKKEYSLHISNPWNEDFHYKFSPDLGFSYLQHVSDSVLLNASFQNMEPFKISYMQFGIGESIGYIKTKRHQRDGFQASIGSGIGIGLNSTSPFYYSLSAGATYYKLINSVVQLSASFSTAYTSTNKPSLLFYRNDVKGSLPGEVSGKAFYAALLGTEFTYLNRQWLSLVQSVYVTIGNGSNKYFKLFSLAPLYSAYTRFKFAIPAIPWMSVSVDLVWSKRKDNWFYLNL